MSTHSYDQFIESCSAYPKPNPFPADWCITEVDDEHAYRLPPSIIRARSLADEDEWAMGIQCSITAEARSEEHTSELQSLMRISYAVFCLKKKKTATQNNTSTN